MVRCDRGLQMLLTTAGAFAAFSLMAIAIGTDYWLYSSAHICNGTNLTMDDGPAPRRARGDLTHSGLWRVCCIEGTAGSGTHPPPDTHTHTHTLPGVPAGKGVGAALAPRDTQRSRSERAGPLAASCAPARGPSNRSHKLHAHAHPLAHRHNETHRNSHGRSCSPRPERSRGAAPEPPGEVEDGVGAGGGWGWGERTGEEGREEGEGLLGNRCLCDCYGNWPSWGGAGRGRGAPGPLLASSRPGPRGGGGGWAPSGSGRAGSPEPDTAQTLLRRLLFHGAPALRSLLGGEGGVRHRGSPDPN